MCLSDNFSSAAKPDGHRWEHSGNTGRGEEEGLYQLFRALVPMKGDGAKIPDDGLAAIKLSRGHKQQTPLRRLCCNGGNHGVVGITLDQPSQRLVAVDARAE